ncbi:protein of unassigned function [Methylobacterium oryzae CBMB20]|uniref:Protein of unassigned function n=1 Tax=Methylobacterium oryzae CBMB20 TaxID=693986 RepID=A0A089Q2A7_9HYPH|nr:protein of unassigned function [Methylobacterium oryzae CBMB20]
MKDSPIVAQSLPDMNLEKLTLLRYLSRNIRKTSFSLPIGSDAGNIACQAVLRPRC